MKRRIGIWQRVRVFYYWLKMIDNYGIIEVCGFCDSPRIDIAESNVNDRIYTATYECKSCKGKATVREVWYKEA